jgi:uncharacterized damage-inducible protein DinB
MPNSNFHDLSRHHVWATDALLAFCESLDDATMQTVVPGTYGSILQTLQHLVDADGSYIARIADAWPEGHPWADDIDVDLATLRERSAVLGKVLTEFLDSDWDVDKIYLAYGGDAVFEVPAGVFVTQIFHHANEHRAHVCTALGALGIEPPIVSAWEYSTQSGRARVVSE